MAKKVKAKKKGPPAKKKDETKKKPAAKKTGTPKPVAKRGRGRPPLSPAERKKREKEKAKTAKKTGGKRGRPVGSKNTGIKKPKAPFKVKEMRKQEKKDIAAVKKVSKLFRKINRNFNKPSNIAAAKKLGAKDAAKAKRDAKKAGAKKTGAKKVGAKKKTGAKKKK